MTRITLAALTFVVALAGVAQAEEKKNDKLMIINGNSGRVVYDDGRNDMYCVTRRHFAGYNDYGNRVYRRSMRCR